MDQLMELLVVLAAAKIGGEAMSRLRQPAVIGELLAGMIVGAGALGWVTIDEGGALSVLAEIGVIVLLYEVGLEIQLTDMARLGRAAVSVAVIGVVAPLALGYGAVVLFGIGEGTSATALFVGAAMTATSVGITARVFKELRSLETDEAKTVIGAAVVDDILGLIILAVVVGSLGGGTASLADYGWLVVRVIAFLVGTVMIGRLVIGPYLRVLRRMRVPGGFVIGVLGLAITLGMAADAVAGLSPIVGAFVAGLIVGPGADTHRIHDEIRPISYFFVPIFFLSVGARVDVSVLAESPVLVGGLAITVAAVIGKLVSGLGAPRIGVDRLIVGVGMVPRGEVGLIFAAIGASQLSHVVSEREIAIVVLMVILTTLGAPMALGSLLRRRARPQPPQFAGGSWRPGPKR